MWYHMKSSRSRNYASLPPLFPPSAFSIRYTSLASIFPPSRPGGKEKKESEHTHTHTQGRSAQLVGVVLHVEYGPPAGVLDAVVLEHAVVDAGVLALDAQGGLGDDGVDDEVVVAVRAVLVGLLEGLGVLAEALLALLAGKGHLERLQELVRLLLVVAVGAVKPFLACSLSPGPRAPEGAYMYAWFREVIDRWMDGELC